MPPPAPSGTGSAMRNGSSPPAAIPAMANVRDADQPAPSTVTVTTGAAGRASELFTTPATTYSAPPRAKNPAGSCPPLSAPSTHTSAWAAGRAAASRAAAAAAAARAVRGSMLQRALGPLIVFRAPVSATLRMTHVPGQVYQAP